MTICLDRMPRKITITTQSVAALLLNDARVLDNDVKKDFYWLFQQLFESLGPLLLCQSSSDDELLESE